MKSYCTGLKTTNADINNCCHEHDKQYGMNGYMTRAEADKQLRECIKAKGRPYRAWIIWAGVRVFGWAFFKR